MAETTPAVVSHHPIENIASGNQDLDVSQTHKQAINQWVDGISALVDQMGDVYKPVKDAWHGTGGAPGTKHAALTAHYTWADAKADHGTKKIVHAQGFLGVDDENATLAKNLGGTTSNGTTAV